MNLKELRQEEYAFIAYEHLKASLAFSNQSIIKVIRIDNLKLSKFIIIKQNNIERNGIKAISSKQFNIPIEDAVFFTSWLSIDFPNIDFEKIKAVS